MNTRMLLLSAAIATAVAACATATSPTGRTQYVGAVSQAQLNQMGAQAFAQLKAQKPQTSNAGQRNYAECVTRAVVAQLPAEWRNIGWETAVFADNEPNAFALPGGKVGLYTGIFSVARNQDQLAGVVAHEIGHVLSRHHDERITRQMGAPARYSCWARWRATTASWPPRVAASWPRPASCCPARARRKPRPTWWASS